MKYAVFWDVTPCTLKMRAIRSSETSVHTRSTRRHIQEDGILREFSVVLNTCTLHVLRTRRDTHFCARNQAIFNGDSQELHAIERSYNDEQMNALCNQ
jgi:hypothetical protein